MPGPGAYDPNSKFAKKYFSIPKSQSNSLIDSKKLLQPGPGSYDPKVFYNSQYESIGLGKGRRKPFYDEKEGVPGPGQYNYCLLYTSPSPRDKRQSRMPSSA